MGKVGRKEKVGTARKKEGGSERTVNKRWHKRGRSQKRGNKREAKASVEEGALQVLANPLVQRIC